MNYEFDNLGHGSFCLHLGNRPAPSCRLEPKDQRGKEKISRDFSISVVSGFREKDPSQKALNGLLYLEKRKKW